VLQKLSANQPVTAAQFNRLVDAINRLLGMKVTPPLELGRAAGGFQLRMTDAGFMARVTAVTDSSGGRHEYEVAEVQPEPNGEWAEKPGGRTLTGVTEWNDNLLAVGTVVRVEPFDNADWRCMMVDPCGVAEKMAGLGLYADQCASGEACCPKINVLNGCHILVAEDGVHVDVDSLVDNETLEVAPVECSGSGDCCPPIRVITNCVEVVTGVTGTATGTGTCNPDGSVSVDIVLNLDLIKTAIPVVGTPGLCGGSGSGGG
jgi:hypothetical protein